MIVFDSTLWHAAGDNRSGRDRLAINQQFTRSYVKQQVDYVRALGDDVVAPRPRTQQLLGWYTRVVTSLDEFTAPPISGFTAAAKASRADSPLASSCPSTAAMGASARCTSGS